MAVTNHNIKHVRELLINAVDKYESGFTQQLYDVVNEYVFNFLDNVEEVIEENTELRRDVVDLEQELNVVDRLHKVT